MDSITSTFSRQSFNFNKFIPKHYLEILMGDCVRLRVFDPLTTLHCFLFQVLSNYSCKEALIHFNLNRIKEKQKKVSMNTAGYCKARKRLDENVLSKMALDCGKKTEEEASQWRWKGRRVLLGDGTTISMEDTESNQQIYPQSKRQKKGLGQPILRMLGLFGLASGSLVDVEIGTYAGKGQAEPSLLKRMINRLKNVDLLVLDKFFTSYFLHEILFVNKIDHVTRARDRFAKSHLGRKKEVVKWIKKPTKSCYDGEEEYSDILDYLEVRFIKSSIKRKGFRTATIYVMTSLTDLKKYSRQDIEELYLQRWGVEVDLRNFKETVKANFLTCKSPSMIHKELWVKILGYNLIRQIIMMTSNYYKDVCPRKRSFKTAQRAYVEGIKTEGIKALKMIVELLRSEVLNSKYRREPRAIKKRRNQYCLLTKPRKLAQKVNYGTSRKKAPVGLLGNGSLR